VYFTRGYKSSTIVWEGVVLFRKLMIVAIASLIKGGLQLVWAAAILVFSMCLTIERMPYNSRLDNRLEIISLVALCLSLILAFHSFFLGQDGEVILFFLVLVNGSAIIVMVMASFSRFRGRIFMWTMRITSFFALAFILPSPDPKFIQMHSRVPRNPNPLPTPTEEYYKTRDELDRVAAETRAEMLARPYAPKMQTSLTSATVKDDPYASTMRVVDLTDDGWGLDDGDKETDV
jgi:hypothetical protein